MVSVPHFALSAASAVVLVMGIVGFTGKQFEVDVIPDPRSPSYHCLVTLQFYNRKTECPGLATTNVKTPRDEGFFGCTPAWDKFQTAFGTSIVASAFAFFSMIASALFGFFPASSTTYRIRAVVVAALMGVSSAFYLISWPIVRSLVSEENCDHKLKGHTMATYTTIVDPAFGYGHPLLIATWVVSFAVAVCAIVHAVLVKPPAASVEDEANGGMELPTKPAPIPVDDEKPVNVLFSNNAAGALPKDELNA